MDKNRQLVAAMVEKCRRMVKTTDKNDPDLPKELQPEHLLFMCGRIEKNAATWPLSRLHRWIGFIQCAMLANRMLDLEGAKKMFDEARTAFGEGDDHDLLDHLDPTSAFNLDLGGQG